MKLKAILLAISCMLIPSLAFPQFISGQWDTEWEWDMGSKTNWVNLLRLDVQVSPWKNGSLQLATLHVARTNDPIIDDWQVFSNIYEENNFAAIAVLGYEHTFKNAHLFVGVRNVNEDYFTSDCTSFFTNSSPGIFPTIGATYPIANYPVSAMTVHFDVSLGNWTFMNSLYNGVGYNAWKKHDNPFQIRPKKDGVFDIMQLVYETDRCYYSAGAAIHNRLFIPDEETGEVDPEVTEKKVSSALWIYGEQSIYQWGEDGNLSLMAQYSQNTKKESACRRYAEVGAVCAFKENTVGVSGQFCRYIMGHERSVELTYSRELTDNITIQPVFQYIHNDGGDYTALCARATFTF